MHRLTAHFPNSAHIVLPVIHVETLGQTLRNTAIARAAGGDGVFLINHSISPAELLRIARGVLTEFPDWWIGVNCLGSEPAEVVAHVGPEISGIWADNAKIDELGNSQAAAERFVLARAEHKWNGLYFGGVAFKYQRPVADLQRAANIGAKYIDVVTTSGPGTGKAAATEKIAALRRGLGKAPLAIASGITPENVTDYLNLANCFLVATGISSSFTELDPRKVKALIDAVGGRAEDGYKDRDTPAKGNVPPPKMRVPFENSYWVVPDRLLAGEHPIDTSEDATIARLTALLDAGVRTFMDLTEEREYIPGYSGLLRSIATGRQIQVAIHRLPIPDRSAPSPETLKTILDLIDGSIASRSPVFVHCFAGIGRTGTIVGCYLKRHRLATAQDVVARISALRSLMPCGGDASPHTPEQVEVIQKWQEGT